MRRSSRMLAAGTGLLAIGSFVACGGGGTTSPSVPAHTPTPVATSTAIAIPTPSPSVKPTTTPTPGKPTPTPSAHPSSTPTPSVACVNQALPGTYTSMIALGNYNPSNGQITGDLVNSQYFVTTFTPSNATPPPTPTPGPTQTPLNIPIYIWSGVYSVNGSIGPITNGCFALVTTQNGQSLPGGSDSGASEAFPQFAGQFNLQQKSNGNLTSFSIATGPNNGSGTFTLDNNTGGNITLGARQSATLDSVRRLLHAAPPNGRLPF